MKIIQQLVKLNTQKRLPKYAVTGGLSVHTIYQDFVKLH